MSFVSGPQYVALPRSENAWVIKDLLPVGGLLNVFGPPKRGKSYLALQLAEAIGNPEQPDVLSFPIETHGPVAYLQADTPRGLWAERIEALRAAGNGFDNVFFADAGLIPYPFNILGDGFRWLKENLKAMDPYPTVVFVDTLREIHGGEENDSGHMRNVVNLLVEAVRPAALVLISHSRKEFGDGSSADLMSDNRGSSYVAGRMDCVLKVNDSSILYQGRTVGEARVVVKRDADTGLFLVSDDFDRVARDIILTTPDLNTSQRAKILQERFPKKSAEACRSLVRRLESVLREVPVRKAAERQISLEA